MSEERATAPKRGERRQALRFVITFSFCVLVLLSGYRAVTDTALNDRYLLQVAWNTTWVLHHLGDSAYLEYYGVTTAHPSQVRAELAAWEKGEDHAEVVEPRMDEPPLTPWETWRHRVLRMRRNNRDASVGPRVVFFLQRGLLTEDVELRKYKSDLGKDLSLTRLKRLQMRRAVDKRKAEITRAISQIRNDPKADKTPLGRIFSFDLVSECGAIEVMVIFFAAVIAFPTRWWKRFVGLVVGIPLMYGVNIFRLVCLGMIGALDTSPGREYFNFAHHYVWQSLYVVFVVAVWLLWIELLVKKRKG